MPRWWLMLFFGSMLFCLIYFLLYPALGSFRGILGWSKQQQYAQEMAAAMPSTHPSMRRSVIRISDAGAQSKALALGRSLFLNNCTTAMVRTPAERRISEPYGQ